MLRSSAIRPLTFTPSKLLTYKRCPLEYSLKYVNRQTTDGDPDPVLARANAAHGILRQAFESFQRTRAFPIDLNRRIEALLPVDAYETADGWSGDVGTILGWAKQALGAFDGSAEILAVERVFEYGYPGNGDVPGFLLRATADLVVQHPDGAVEHIDWKTGGSVWIDGIQTVATRIVVGRAYNDRPIRSTTVFLATNTTRSDILTREQVKGTWEEIKALVRAIGEDDHWLPISNPLCPRCPFYGNGCSLYRQAGTIDELTAWLDGSVTTAAK